MTEAAAGAPAIDATFTHGATMRHVLVMSATGAIGLIAIFVVDFLSLLYVSWLNDPVLVAGVEYATQVLFFLVSVSIGLAIAVTALVSRAIGAGDPEAARRLAASTLVHVFVTGNVLALLVFLFRGELLRAVGAEGPAYAVADRFLVISVPANALLGLGMSLSGVLRAAGDARRAMYVTLFGGIATAGLDPLLIFGLGLGVDGAAISTVLARLVVVAVGVWGAVGVHGLVARPRLGDALRDLPALAAIAGPAILTNLAAPVSNGYVLRVFSRFGESSVAAFAIIDRITPLAFALLYAMSGSVGPIVGQNYGARLFDRVRRTLTDCFTLSLAYSLIVWLALFLAAPRLADLFGAVGRTREIVLFYCAFGVAAWLFFACVFVANAAFNNLGHPLLATIFNWGRATLGTIPFVTVGARLQGPEGAYIGLLVGSAAFGIASVWASLAITRRLARRE